MHQWTKDLGLRAPVVCAPMGGVAGGRLAAAVSQAGGLGMIGMGSAGSATALRRELAEFADAGGGADPQTGGRVPWGIGMVSWGVDRDPDMLEVALAAAPSIISVGFGDWKADPHPAWLDRVHEAGIRSITQVATADEARLAASAGVNALVARGKEAGGHGVHVRPRRALLEEVLAAVDVPVLAAGAIHTPKQVAEAIGAGAAAVWIGTAFQACPGALTGEAAKRALFAATGADTVVSRVMDVALDRPWPEHIPERMLRTEFVSRWHGRERELARDELAKAEFRAAIEAGDFSVVPVDAGEGVTALIEERTAAQVIDELIGAL